MRSGMDICRERGLFGEGVESEDGDAFDRVGLPMVVACRQCDHTMSICSAMVDEDEYTYCKGCAE